MGWHSLCEVWPHREEGPWLTRNKQSIRTCSFYHTLCAVRKSITSVGAESSRRIDAGRACIDLCNVTVVLHRQAGFLHHGSIVPVFVPDFQFLAGVYVAMGRALRNAP